MFKMYTLYRNENSRIQLEKEFSMELLEAAAIGNNIKPLINVWQEHPCISNTRACKCQSVMFGIFTNEPKKITGYRYDLQGNGVVNITPIGELAPYNQWSYDPVLNTFFCFTEKYTNDLPFHEQMKYVWELCGRNNSVVKVPLYEVSLELINNIREKEIWTSGPDSLSLGSFALFYGLKPYKIPEYYNHKFDIKKQYSYSFAVYDKSFLEVPASNKQWYKDTEGNFYVSDTRNPPSMNQEVMSAMMPKTGVELLSLLFGAKR